ncbi:MAG: DNA topoisomerase I [Candidatus Woesearchaeota archaeon]|jgi:DNA topoisomerase-1|nr:DNA topoisomerase I [Candidatus Woesearchaeota archaeon]
MYELIISEKPQAAEKIAKALADSSPKKIREHNVNYFSLTHKGKEIRVASAVGHLYILGEKGGESWEYPIFDTEWKPIFKVNKSAGYTADYIRLLTDLGKEANEVTVAADFDIEGEVIGLNVVRFALGRKDANRMKFSSLTKDALVKSYEEKQDHLEWGQAKAGETRHNLDWFYGINLSRAFTQSIKKGTNQFKVLSTGRVQAPALHFLANRERDIAKFIPEAYSEIYLDGLCKDTPIKAQYEDEKNTTISNKTKKVEKSKIFDEEFAKKVAQETTGKDGKITAIEAKKFTQAVPTPFDLTSLQMEASTMLGYSPKRTLEIAQKLYIEGITSYPRTSSQKLPAELELKKVIEKLAAQPIYREKAKIVLEINPQIKPNEGKKTDPAHPAIHPTGEVPKKLEGQEAKLYDLIVKRFFSIFGKPAVRETNTVKIDVNSHQFMLKGTRTLERNWHDLYEPYLKFEEVELPTLENGAQVINKGIDKVDKETSPPKRYTDASIIKELEKRGLGTKATRAEILSSLRDRGYVVDKSIKVTELGLEMDDVLKKETPDLIDEKLTRQFDEEMEAIREGKATPENILKIARTKLEKVLGDIKKNEVDIGQKLAKASKIVEVERATVGKCPNCENGILMIRSAKKTGQKFVGCNGYPECKTIFKLPQVPVVKTLTDQPDEEGNIFVFAGKSEGKMRKVLINPKPEDLANMPKTYKEEGMTCPTCEKGQMALRKSFYGEFLGCNNYPECKTMMKITHGSVDTTPISPKPKKAPAKKKEPAKKKAPAKETKSKKE